MREVTEQQILALAPNPAAASNGKKISQKGGFVKLERTQDDTLYMGECTGSGKSNYITSADYIDEANPVFRCTCPSRQFPCKHSLALMYEMLAKKEFGICEVPEDILKKREKKQAKENKANEAATIKKKVNIVFQKERKSVFRIINFRMVSPSNNIIHHLESSPETIPSLSSPSLIRNATSAALATSRS